MGQYRHGAGLPGDADGVLGIQPRLLDIPGLALGQVEIERLLDGADHALADQHGGDVGAADALAAGFLLDLLGGDRQPQL